MDIHGFFTKKGLLLAAKLAAGSTLKYTRVCAGEAETALSASALSQIRQTLSVGAARRTGDTAVLPVTLEAGMAGSAYTLRELGVYAQDPDEGEILYKVYRLTEAVKIDPASRLVLRFYLEETVSQDLNVTVVRASAGLLTEADLEPVRATLEAKSVPARRVTLTAGELPAYVASLPRLVTESLAINVTGELDEPLRLNGFYGSGIITIQGSGNFSIRNYTVVTNCSIPIYLTGVEFSDSGTLSTKYLLEVYRSSAPVYLSKCIFTGINKTTVMTGVESYYGACISCINCSFTNLYAAVLAGDNCLITVETKESGGSVYSNNTYGAYVARGGIIMLSGNTPKTLGGTTNGKYRGGAIINSDGTLQ